MNMRTDMIQIMTHFLRNKIKDLKIQMSHFSFIGLSQKIPTGSCEKFPKILRFL